jgi:hypothetical protein
MQKVSIMPQHEWKLFDAPRNNTWLSTITRDDIPAANISWKVGKL